jgi:4-hydroxy-tetrahydrodipicolinate reductase
MAAPRILVVGASGRLGSAIVHLGGENPAYAIAGTVGRGEPVEAKLGTADVVIDVSHRSGTAALTAAAAAAGKPLVIGTTGHDAGELLAIQNAAEAIPVVLAPNFSVGVNLLFYLTKKTAEILGPDYDQEIVEMHHRNKLDAPSGTAKRLAEVLCEVKGRPYDELVRDGRSGEPGKRTRDEIGMHALRGGDVIGDHTVVFAGIGERVELTHKASTRDTFAVGALRAAAWTLGQKPGLYSMQDVLGLK